MICGHCLRFFERFRCSRGFECDCPKCQGYCSCNRALAEKPEAADEDRVGLLRERLTSYLEDALEYKRHWVPISVLSLHEIIVALAETQRSNSDEPAK